MEETLAFFSALFAAAPDELHGYLWTLRGSEKKSHWFNVGDGPEAVAELAVNLAADTNVYIGVSAAPTAGTEFQRVKSPQSAGIYGLWADLDFDVPDVHKKLNYPPDEGAVMEILAALGVPPSMVVHSGNGLQAWWLFNEFLEFENDADRSAAASLAHRWHATISARAAERNYIFDSVYDLARVLRVPGTFNYKTDPPKLTSLVSVEDRLRYSLDDFEPFILSQAEIVASGPPASDNTYVVGELRLNPLAQPDDDMLNAFRSNDEQFAKTLDRRRTDFKDQSPSTYDMSLASQCVGVDWEDQDVVDLLIWNRRLHGDDLKLRLDYYKRTLATAHTRRATLKAWEELDDAVMDLGDAKQSGDEESEHAARRRTLEMVSDIIGIRITHATRYTATKPMFGIKVEGRFDIELGTMEDMTYKKVADQLLASDVKRDLPPMKAPDWRKAQVALREACMDQELGEEATEEGAMKGWIRDYLMLKKPTENLDEAMAQSYPFLDTHGEVNIFTRPFEQWLTQSQSVKTNVTQIGRLLSRVGCVRQERKVTVNHCRTTRSFWKIPEDVLNPS